MQDHSMIKGKSLRRGRTTGSCAAAAAKAATALLLTGHTPSRVRITTPKGILLEFLVEESSFFGGISRCAVRKDAGDDPDATDGILIFAAVSRTPDEGLTIDGGEGIGRVTLPGLDQPVGAAAINAVPRRMITEAVGGMLDEWGTEVGLQIVIEAPDGARVAQKTFNPRLGIVGGISILGTTGIVEPMSEAALIDTTRAELSVLRAAGRETALLVPGNYGEEFARETLGLSRVQAAVCSNFIGEAVDYAAQAGFAGMLLVGHAGKLIKLAGGIFNTHSRVADARMELLAAHAALAGAKRETVFALFACATVDAAFDLLEQAGILQDVLQTIFDRIDFYLQNRAGETPAGAVLFTNTRGLLGMTREASGLLDQLKAEEQRCQKQEPSME